MLIRILRAGVILGAIAAAGGALIARSKLDATAREQVAREFPSGGVVQHGRVHGRLLPPTVVVSDFNVAGDHGARVLHADRYMLPLDALSRFGARPATLSGARITVQVPRTSGAPFRTLLNPKALGDWTVEDGSLELRTGDPPSAPALTLSGVHVENLANRFVFDGHGGSGITAHAAGTFGAGGIDVTIALGPIPAVEAASLLVDPARATLRGGSITFEGRLTATESRLHFKGDLDARDVLIEGTGTPSRFESRLRAGSARIPLEIDLDLSHGGDRAKTIRDALGR